MTAMRKETNSLGVVEVAADKLWGAQTRRSDRVSRSRTARWT